MKIKVFECNIKANLEDDYLKSVAYFKKHNLDIVFEREQTQVLLPEWNVRQQLVMPNDGKYDVVMYVYDRPTQRPNGTGFAENFSRKTSCVFVPTGIPEDASEGNYLIIIHEIMHCLFNKVRNNGILINDVMDSYLQNNFPDHPDGNFARSFKLLLPYWNILQPQVVQPPSTGLYKPPNFSLKELVSPAILIKLGEKAWELLDERALKNLQFFRETFGITYVNHQVLNYRGFDACEFRKDGTSQHNHGRAFDCNFRNYTAEQVRDWLKVPTNLAKVPYPNIWVEIGTSWFHFDVRYSDKKGIYFFNP